MQSVAIMSMQRIHNYGSSLQAFALRNLLAEVRPLSKVSFVDFRPGPILASPEDGGDASSVPRQGYSRALAKLQEYAAAETSLRNKLRFFNHKRRYGNKYFPMIGLPETRNFDLNVDVEIIGSDEVFNCIQSNTNVGYSRDLFGYLSPAKRIVSYAGSFGNTTLEKLRAVGVQDEIAAAFAQFHAISVRDQNSANIVESLIGKRPSVHLDPTLVYNIVGSSGRVPPSRQFDEKYVIVYGYSGRLTSDENDAVRRFARRRGARVLAFGGLQAAVDQFIDCDPFTLLAFFRDAEAVITDTFHGTIFAAINGVTFATIVRRSQGRGYGNEEKVGYLLESLGLEDRVLGRGRSLTDLLETPPDFDVANRVRAEERERTLAFLDEALDFGEGAP